MNFFSRLFNSAKKPQTASRAIRQGAKTREQWMGDEFFYRDGNTIKSNIFGALLEGLVLGTGKSSKKLIDSYLKTGDLPPEKEFPEIRHLWEDFPKVFSRNLICNREGCPEMGEKYHVFYPCHLFLLHLNTKHHVPHEKIADIVEAMENDQPLDKHFCTEFITDISEFVTSYDEIVGSSSELSERKIEQEPSPLIRDLLNKGNFGRETEIDHDPAFFDTISDSHRILRTVIGIGVQENSILFKRPVYFSITDSSYAQATAMALEDSDIVFLTEGFINRIRRSICKLLSRRDTFSTIGSPDKEKHHRKADGDETLLPLCPERKKMANGAIQRALEFVFIHELAHIFYGHHSYLEKLDTSAEPFPFLMVPPQNKDSVRKERYANETQMVRHVMEIQADRYAGDVTLGLAFREIWGQRHQLSASSDEMIRKRTIQELGIALTVVFNIVESISISNGFHTHPHPKYRRLATTMSAHVVWMSTYREKPTDVLLDPLEFLNIINNIQDETNNAWRCANLSSVDDTSSDLSELEFRSLLNQAIELFPKLDSRFDRNHVI